jgi:transcriptional regulator with XRE-family HTH domain
MVERLHTIRKCRGLDPEAFAKLIGVNPANYLFYERSERVAWCGWSRLVAAMNAAGIDITWEEFCGPDECRFARANGGCPEPGDRHRPPTLAEVEHQRSPRAKAKAAAARARQRTAHATFGNVIMPACWHGRDERARA